MSTMHNEDINVTFICDDNYALGTGVAISSLKNHRNLTRHYKVFIIANKVSSVNLKLLREMNEDSFQVEIIDAERIADYSDFKQIKTAAHVSPTALYKFNIPGIFEHLGKILYLDCDIIVRDDLTELYDTDISGCYAAVCEDIGAETYPAPYNRRLKIKHEKYFNSGVMLLNLALLREDHIAEKLIEYKKYGINHYMDQDAFNVVFAERVVYFSFLYNMTISAWLPYPCDVLNKYYGFTLQSKVAYFTDAKILHFSSPEKPWKNRRTIGAEEWLAEYVASPFVQQANLRQGNVESKNRTELEGEIYYADLITEREISLAFNEPPLVSVIVPVYNAEKYLGECVESLMVQTLQNAEFIFVDDGSSDNSLEILHLYQKLDNRIQIYTQKNQYAGVARNNGMKHAKGRYITFLDSDDVMLPDALELFYKSAETTSADVVISSAYRFTTDYNQREVAGWCLRNEYAPIKKVFSPDDCKNTLFQISAGAPWGKIYRRTLLEENKICFPPLPRSEDFCFVYWAFSLAKRITTLNAELILYRIIDGSGSLEDAKDRFPLAATEGYRILWNTLKNEGKQDELHRTFVNYVINGVTYALRTFRTCEAFKLLSTCFKEEVIDSYNIDFENDQYFYAKGEFNYLKEICSYDDVDTFLFKKYKQLLSGRPNGTAQNKPNSSVANSELTFYKNEVKLIRASWSYRIGRFVTYIPRKVRGGIRCYKEHGLYYTLGRIRVKFFTILGR